EGYSEVEFRYSASGVPYLMEVNPRLSASVEVAVRAGVDFPRLLYQWARGSPTTASPARAVLDFGLTFLRPMAYDGLDWSDLRPAVAAARGFARGIGR